MGISINSSYSFSADSGVTTKTIIPMSNDEVVSLWPELEWIIDPALREKTARVWQLAFEKSVLTPVLYFIP